MLQNLWQFKCQSYTIEQHLNYYMTSLESLANQALDQLIKGYYLGIYNATLLADEINALHTANQKQQQKLSKPVLSILQEDILTIQ